MNLPDIVLKYIGNSKGGARAGEVAGRGMDVLQRNINGAVKHLNLDQVKEAVGSAVSGAREALEKVASGAKDLIENLPGGDAVKGFWGNEKKDKNSSAEVISEYVFPYT